MGCRSVRFVTSRLLPVLAAIVLVASCGSDAGDVSATVPVPDTDLVDIEAPAIAFTNEDESEAEQPAEPEAEQVVEEADESAMVGDGLFPTVVDATATTTDGTTWRVNVTLSSEYDSPARYADAWRVLDASDTELGVRVLTHDHANEQPFTRSHTIDIPEGTTTVFIEGRDQVNGWSGERFELALRS